MFAAPRKIRFAIKALNLVDLMAIIPFYLELLLTLCGVDDRMLRDLRWAFLVVRILRVLRVIRIIKLGRFSSGLQTFGMTLRRSQKQLQMMAIVLLTVSCLTICVRLWKRLAIRSCSLIAYQLYKTTYTSFESWESKKFDCRFLTLL